MMKKLLISAALLVASLSQGLARAEDGHSLTTLKGDYGIDLKVYDHAMAGAIKDFVIWGSVNEAAGTSELIMRRDDQDVKALFAKTDTSFGGTVAHQNDKGLRSTTVRFAGLDRNKNEYTFTVNGNEIKASVVAEDFRNNHFIKPTYTVRSANGESFSFKFEGEACYKYSLHLLTLMIAAVNH